jgi:hypothetical protein
MSCQWMIMDSDICFIPFFVHVQSDCCGASSSSSSSMHHHQSPSYTYFIFSSSSFYPPKSHNWALLAGIRQDTLCKLVTVCFHNLVTYAQRLQDLYSMLDVLNAYTHWTSVYRLIRRMWESPAPSNLGVSYELEHSCHWRAANLEPFALESDALPLRHWLSLYPYLL